MKLHGYLNRSSIHRPRLAWYWVAATRGFLALTWGSRYGEPVCGVDLEVTVPRWLLRLDEHRRARQSARR